MTNSAIFMPGVQIGHAQNLEALTGCTVLLCPNGAIGGVEQRGGAPGTRETDLLRPMHVVDKVNAILLAGGSAFGLDAATGVMRYLEERGQGFDVRVAKVPVVPAAILFDLELGRSDVRPDAEMGYQACLNASSDWPAEGNVGVGTGATVGKILGLSQAMKGGFGAARQEIGAGVVIAAVAGVNCLGDVVDPTTGAILAGARAVHKGPIHIGAKDYYLDSLQFMRSLAGRTILNYATRGNTIIGAVLTNARLTKEEANIIAQMAHDGIARTIRPAHTLLDGDTIFALASGEKRADVNVVGVFAAEVFAQAITRAVHAAQPIAELPASPQQLPDK